MKMYSPEWKLTNKIESAIIKKVLRNGGRWCTLEMKTGETLKVVRIGYLSYEYFERDKCELVNENGEVLVKGETPRTIAEYICENWCIRKAG